MTIEGVRRVVAVKVRHPGVADIIRRDFQVLIKDLIHTRHSFNQNAKPNLQLRKCHKQLGIPDCPALNLRGFGQIFSIFLFPLICVEIQKASDVQMHDCMT